MFVLSIAGWLRACLLATKSIQIWQSERKKINSKHLIRERRRKPHTMERTITNIETILTHMSVAFPLTNQFLNFSFLDKFRYLEYQKWNILYFTVFMIFDYYYYFWWIPRADKDDQLSVEYFKNESGCIKSRISSYIMYLWLSCKVTLPFSIHLFFIKIGKWTKLWVNLSCYWVKIYAA